MAKRRLFLALWPDNRQRNTLRDVFRPLLSPIEGKAVDRRNWHVTLTFIGEFPEQKIPQLLAGLALIEAQPFRLRFDCLNFWPRPRIACLNVIKVPEELKQLKQDLETLLVTFDVAPEDLEYRPHITAVRAARPFQPIRMARAVELLWSGIELIESISVPGGVRYRPLKQQLRHDS